MATDNPLSAFIRGFQGSIERGQKIAQQEEENALNRQLREIQMLNAQRQMQEALKTPEQKAREALTAQLITEAVQRGGVRAAEPGLEGQEIALPQAIGQTARELDLAGLASPVIQSGPLSIQSGVPQDSSVANAIANLVAPSSAPETFQIPRSNVPVEYETPVPGTGGAFVESPVMAREAQARELEKIKATADARRAPAGTRYIMTEQGLIPLPTAGPAPTEVEPIKTTGGEPLTKPTTPRSTGAAKGLTANAEERLYAKAGAAKISPEEIESKYVKDGVLDWRRLSIDANKKISEDKTILAQEKINQLPAAERAKANGMIAAHTGLKRLMEDVNKFKIQGKEPDAWSRAVATALEAPPDGVFSALYQSAIGQSLTADEATNTALRAMVRSAVTKANAGLSQTEREIANVSQYVPKSNDTIEETLRKGALLEAYLIDQVESIITDPKDWLANIKAEKAKESSGSPRGTTATEITPAAQKYLQKLGK